MGRRITAELTSGGPFAASERDSERIDSRKTVSGQMLALEGYDRGKAPMANDPNASLSRTRK
ncbi:unnamed protein product [Dovyalis caffra]|uniref:Uncharacterized protein n=1 Tax=Dovyalis caffra TaxID=77055 RepID=A0AAV1QL93_9ROSI|nr:unnamed protein product [Dovyalis caffra]CAK7328692.1 unnamed protein product [Dovyalis caffra]